MHVHGISAYYAVTQKSIKWTWVDLFEMNVKIEQGSDFDVDNHQNEGLFRLYSLPYSGKLSREKVSAYYV